MSVVGIILLWTPHTAAALFRKPEETQKRAAGCLTAGNKIRLECKSNEKIQVNRVGYSYEPNKEGDQPGDCNNPTPGKNTCSQIR